VVVTALWSEGRAGWEILRPDGFPDEKSLQELVAAAPDLLPLSGTPRIVVLGREVLLGSGYVDVLAIEASGRPVVIEVKLRNNTESRRAVVAQILAYAAALHGSTAEEFERRTVARQLAGRSLVDVVRDAAQAEVADAEDFRRTLDSALQDGGFRLVLVLDQAPQELVKLVGYLESVTHGLVVDIVTVTSYDVGGKRIVVPQRVEPERPVRPEGPLGEPTAAPASRVGEVVAGTEAFRQRVAAAPAEHREVLGRFADWAERLSRAGLADVSTYFGKRGEVVLLPYLLPDRAGLVSLYMWPDGKPTVQWWRSVFDRRAPGSIAAVSAAGGAEIGRGTIAPHVDDRLLDALFDAYTEAAGTTARALT
jgi:hypothetical protein